MSIVIKTPWNYRETGPDTEYNSLPSKTQPDELLTIREMLERHVRGLPVSSSAAGEPMYYGDEFGYVPTREELDLSEIGEYREHFSQRAREINERLKSEEKERQTKDIIEQYEKSKTPKSDPPPTDPT